MRSSCVGVEKDNKQMPVAFVFCITFTNFAHTTSYPMPNCRPIEGGGVVSWYPPVCYRFAIWRVVIRLEPCSRTQPPATLPLKPPTKAPTPPTSFLPSHPSCNFLIKKLMQQQWVSIRWEFETNTKDRRYRHWYLIFFLHTSVHVNLKGERQEQISRWLIDWSITSA